MLLTPAVSYQWPRLSSSYQGASDKEEDKMLEVVREGIKKQKEAADGTKAAFDASADVQQKRLDKKMKDEAIDKKLQELKARKGK